MEKREREEIKKKEQRKKNNKNSVSKYGGIKGEICRFHGKDGRMECDRFNWNFLLDKRKRVR